MFGSYLQKTRAQVNASQLTHILHYKVSTNIMHLLMMMYNLSAVV